MVDVPQAPTFGGPPNPFGSISGPDLTRVINGLQAVSQQLSTLGTKTDTVNTNLSNINSVLTQINFTLSTLPAWVTPPATAGSNGVTNQIAQDGNFFYVCTAPNVWRRVGISVW